MKKIAVVYGSSTDNTKTVAELIAQKLSGEEVTLLDVADLGADDLADYPNLILGTSTWGMGDLQDDWDGYLSNLKSADLSGKVIAFFGLGDSSSYPDTFVDGMGVLYETVKDKGAKLVGEVSTEGYDFDASVAVVGDNFVGVAIDEDNENDQTDVRVEAWVAKISPEFQ